MKLPPVKPCFVFASINGPLRNMFILWELFQMCESTDVIRQKGDQKFVEALNNIRIEKAVDSI